MKHSNNEYGRIRGVVFEIDEAVRFIIADELFYQNKNLGTPSIAFRQSRILISAQRLLIDTSLVLEHSLTHPIT